LAYRDCIYVSLNPILCSGESEAIVEPAVVGIRTPESAESTDRSTDPNVSVATLAVIQSAKVWHSSFVPSVLPGSVGLNWPTGKMETSSPCEPQPAGMPAAPPAVAETVNVPASRSTVRTYARCAAMLLGRSVCESEVPSFAEATRTWPL
jgi:hypothetical protein